MGAGEGNGFGGDAGVVWRDEGRGGVVVLEQRQQGIGRRGAAGHPRQVVEEAAAVAGQGGVVVGENEGFLGDARLGAVAAAESSDERRRGRGGGGTWRSQGRAV